MSLPLEKRRQSFCLTVQSQPYESDEVLSTDSVVSGGGELTEAAKSTLLEIMRLLHATVVRDEAKDSSALTLQISPDELIGFYSATGGGPSGASGGDLGSTSGQGDGASGEGGAAAVTRVSLSSAATGDLRGWTV